jgi:ADP-ribose pyrophosphatase YjhB (NUDIX family)
MKFCSQCGNRVTLSQIPGDTVPRFYCALCETVHYQNPKIIVGCLAEKDGKILLCKRAIEPCIGKWGIPAGYLENGETLEEGAVRETFEESNGVVAGLKLQSIYNLPHVNQVYIYFTAKLVSWDFTPNSETSEAALFSPDEIPWDELAFTSNKFALEKYLSDEKSENDNVFMGTHRPDLRRF